MITVFMLYCAMQPSEKNISKIYFKSVNDCSYYAEKLSDQQLMSEDGTETYQCICKLVPQIDSDKVKVY